MSYRRTATSNHYKDWKFLVGKEIEFSIISKAVKQRIAEKEMAASMERRRKIINEINIEVGDIIDKMYGRPKKIVGFTRDFRVKFDDFSLVDPYSIVLLGWRIIKK